MKGLFNNSEPVFPFQDLSLKNLIGEIWKPMINFEDYYEVSNLGRVKTIEREISFIANGHEIIRTLPAIIKKQSVQKTWNPNTKDYAVKLFAQLKINDKQYHIAVARLVFMAFTETRLDFARDKLIVLPRDFDGRNNRIENLYATSFSDRSEKAFLKGRIRKGLNKFVTTEGRQRQAVKLGVPVTQFDLKGTLVAQFQSINDACRECDLSSASVRRAIKKKGTAGGFIWLLNSKKKQLSKKQLSAINRAIVTPVQQFTLKGELIQQFPSISAAGRQTGIDISGISKAVRSGGKAGGFLWKNRL